MSCDMPFIGHSLGVGTARVSGPDALRARDLRGRNDLHDRADGRRPDVGGFSIEDMILITETGPKVLSDAIGTEDMIVIDG